MDGESPDPSRAIDRLRDGLQHVFAALASGDLNDLVTAQDRVLTTSLPLTSHGPLDDAKRLDRREALLAARSTLNDCRRLNGALAGVTDAWLTLAHRDYDRHGAPSATTPTSTSRLSCRA